MNTASNQNLRGYRRKLPIGTCGPEQIGAISRNFQQGLVFQTGVHISKYWPFQTQLVQCRRLAFLKRVESDHGTGCGGRWLNVVITVEKVRGKQ